MQEWKRAVELQVVSRILIIAPINLSITVSIHGCEERCCLPARGCLQPPQLSSVFGSVDCSGDGDSWR